MKTKKVRLIPTSAIRNRHMLLACFLPAKRNQQEACQKSRRDGDLLHRSDGFYF
jgi:hypothetical protein